MLWRSVPWLVFVLVVMISAAATAGAATRLVGPVDVPCHGYDSSLPAPDACSTLMSFELRAPQETRRRISSSVHTLSGSRASGVSLGVTGLEMEVTAPARSRPPRTRKQQ
jgi:hypothetical protein